MPLGGETVPTAGMPWEGASTLRLRLRLPWRGATGPAGGQRGSPGYPRPNLVTASWQGETWAGSAMQKASHCSPSKTHGRVSATGPPTAHMPLWATPEEPEKRKQPNQVTSPFATFYWHSFSWQRRNPVSQSRVVKWIWSSEETNWWLAYLPCPESVNPQTGSVHLQNGHYPFVVKHTRRCILQCSKSRDKKQWQWGLGR